MSSRLRIGTLRALSACSSKPPDSSRQLSYSFLTLPAELRVLVYEELKPTSYHVRLQMGRGYISLRFWTIPVAMLRTCRLVNKEACHVLRPRLYEMMLLPPEIHIDTTQLFRVVTAQVEFGHFMKVLHKVSRNRGTVTTLGNEKVAVPISESGLMGWTRRSTPEMLWLRNALLVPIQGRCLIAFLQQAELFFRGDYVSASPTWVRLRHAYGPSLPDTAGLQIFIHHRDANGNRCQLNSYSLVLFGMFIQRVRPLTDVTHIFETTIRATGPIRVVHTNEGERVISRRFRVLYRIALRNGRVMWRPDDLVPLENEEG